MSQKEVAAAGAKLGRAISKAAAKATPTTGAVLGYVVEMAGQAPGSLTVELDTGQVIPQAAGPAMPPGTRVLCHWIEQGHNVAVQPLGGGAYPYALGVGIYDGSFLEPLYGPVSGGGLLPPLIVGGDVSTIEIQQPGYYLLTGYAPPGTTYTVEANSFAFYVDGSMATELPLSAGDTVIVRDLVGDFARVGVDWRAPYTFSEG